MVLLGYMAAALVLGATLGGTIGGLIYEPNPDALIEFTRGAWVVAGAIVGGCLGLLVGFGVGMVRWQRQWMSAEE